MITTVGDLIKALERFDPNERVQMTYGWKHEDSDGTKTESFENSLVEAVEKGANDMVSIISPEGWRQGSQMDPNKP